MPVSSKGALRVKGLTLGQSVSQIDGLAVCAGRNFMPALAGPRSYFGAKVNSAYPLTDGMHPATFRQNGKALYFDNTGVYMLDCEGRPELIYAIERNYEERKFADFCYPWTTAYVGESHYYSHPMVGVIEFDMFTCTWSQWQLKEKGFSDLIFGITEANGSLIVLSRDTVTWSAFDRGSDIIEDQYDGVGSQSLHLAKFGRPSGVYSDGQGFFTFTSNGVMYSRPMSGTQILSGESLESAAIFRHDKYSDAESAPVPISAYAIAKISKGLIAYITKKGIMQVGRFANNQFADKELDPIMSRWMREKFFECFCYEDCDSIRLEYNPDENYLYMSVKERGCRNSNAYQQAFVYDLELEEWGTFNRLHRFLGFMGFGDSQRDSWGYQDPMGYTFRFDARLNEHDVVINGMRTVGGLNSYVDIGEIRLDDDSATDYFSEISDLEITSENCPEAKYVVEVISEEACASIGTDFPHLTGSRKGTNYYRYSNQGLSHTVRLIARNIGEHFALTTLRFSLKKRGRL